MCTIGGVVALDLRGLDGYYPEDEHDATRKLKDLALAPAGADVVIHVKPRQYANWQGLDYLRRHGQHLGSITIHCEDAETVGKWVTMARGEGL